MTDLAGEPNSEGSSLLAHPTLLLMKQAVPESLNRRKEEAMRLFETGP